MSIPKVLNENTPVREAVKAFVTEDVSGFPVVNDEGHLVGVLSVSDILWYEATYDDAIGRQPERCDRLQMRQNCETAFMHNQTFLAQRVKDSMTPKPITITPDVLLSEAANHMLTKHIHFLPVVAKHGAKAGDVVGILTRSDIMRCMASALL